MPFKINVGCCRKMGEPNYGSRGASVSFETVLDDTWAANQPKLRQSIRELFELARAALAEELGRPAGQPAPSNGDNASPTSSEDGAPRMASERQGRAIWAMCKARGLRLPDVLKPYGVATTDQLTVKEASAVIDRLKKVMPEGARNES
jgi:hypothetical protein